MTGIPADLFNALEHELPLALLPVRLEMRFGTRDATTSAGAAVSLPVLRLRIFPDDLSIDDHQEGLTDLEVAAGRAYWAAVAGPHADDATAERRTVAGWDILSRQVGAHRATFVAEETRDAAREPTRRSLATPATAELLPDRWVVTGWSGEQRVIEALGGPVRKPLAVGPTPRDDGVPMIDPNADLPTDAGMRWLADYEEAVAAGMAVTIDLTTPDAHAAGTPAPALAKPIERLFVFGVRETLPDGHGPDHEAESLADLVARHRAVHGASFLLQGTPTNNLQGRRSTWRSRAQTVPAQQQAGPAPASARPPDVLRGGGTNAQVAATAFGMRAGALDALERGEAREQQHARLMSEALFPVTWGELIGTLVAPTVVDVTRDESVIRGLETARSFVRAHWLDFVRARGPLPVLLLGRQPYGILPVTDPNAWALQAGEPAPLAMLATVLQRLRPFWELAARQAPALLAGPQDVDEASRRLIEILGLGPVPHPASYGMRAVTGELASIKYLATRPDAPTFSADGRTLSDTAMSRLVATTQARLYRRLLGELPAVPKTARFHDMELHDPRLLVLPVAKTVKSGDVEVGPRQYLKALGQAQWHDLLESNPLGNGAPPADLLFQLVHRALRRANDESVLATIRKLAGWDRLAELVITHPVELPHTALGGGRPAPATTFETPLRELAATVDLTSVAQALHGASLSQIVANRERLGQLVALEPRTAEFVDTQRAVAELAAASLSDAEYERLFGETIATCATRLDAWVTSIATQRLDLLRSRRASGVRIGAYGWLVDLPPYAEPRFEAAALAGRAQGAQQPVAPRRRVGYVHAPSLAQAETASVLRSAELSHGDEAGSSLARLDLTSARVRKATAVLDAVHNGQPLGAVLGYRLERSLHDAGRHTTVDALRKAFPQRVVPTSGEGNGDDNGAREQVVPHEVVDGEQAWRAWKDRHLPPTVDAAAVDPAFRELDGAVEAVADLLVAEGLHHLVSGNHTRAAATLNAVAYGDPPPAEFDVVRTPRSGRVITHRVVLALDAHAGDGGASAWDREAPRAKLEPALERWAERLLGAPDRWACEVVPKRGVRDRAAAGPERRTQVRLSDVAGLCALDVVHEAAASGGAQSPLADRLVAAANVVDGEVVQPDAARIPDRALGWSELLALAGAARDVLASARTLTAHDLRAPDEDRNGAPVPERELAKRRATLRGLRTEMKNATTKLAEVLAAPNLDASACRKQLAKLARFGVPSATPPEALDDALLRERAGAAHAAAARALDASDDPAPSLDALQRAARALLGPTTVLAPAVGDASPLARSPSLRSAPPRALDDWVTRAGRVRPAVATMEDLRMFAAALGRPEAQLHVAQLPLADDDAWLGGPLRELATPSNPLRRHARPARNTAHVVIVTDDADLPAAVSGLVLDEWSEVIPDPTQTTGVGLHYDAPNARAAQAVLLAVHPDPARANLSWSWEMIERMLADTLALARLRTVELEQLAPTAVDEYLPAVYPRDGLDNIEDLHSSMVRLVGQLGVPERSITANRDLSMRHG